MGLVMLVDTLQWDVKKKIFGQEQQEGLGKGMGKDCELMAT